MPLSRLYDSLRDFFRRITGDSGDGTSTTAPKLLICPNSKEVRVEQTIGPEGGTLQVGEHRLVLPKGAVTERVKFTGVLLADRVLKVQFRANGQDGYKFAQPAALTLGYGRCDVQTDPQRLRIYKIDPKTNRILAEMGGKVDPNRRSVTAALNSLSTYTLGTP